MQANDQPNEGTRDGHISMELISQVRVVQFNRFNILAFHITSFVFQFVGNFHI